MKNLLKHTFVCFSLISAISQSYGQTKLELTGKIYTIPKFVSTSVKHPNVPPILEQAEVLKPITESVEDIEIRVNYLGAFPLLPTSTLVLKGNTRKFIIKNIHYYYLRLYKDSLRPKQFKTFKHGNTPYLYTEKTITAPDTLFSSLIKNHLFDFDEKDTRDSLAKAKVKADDREVYDGYIIVVEIKIKDQYRMLRLDPIRYPLDVKELQPIGLLSNTFDELLKLTN